MCALTTNGCRLRPHWVNGRARWLVRAAGIASSSLASASPQRFLARTRNVVMEMNADDLISSLSFCYYSLVLLLPRHQGPP